MAVPSSRTPGGASSAAGCIDEIVMVVREGMQAEFKELAGVHQFRKPFRLVVGGKERQDSVWNGLEALSPGAEIVAIQDAARPCTSEALIAATVAAARETGAAVAAQPLTDTIKESARRQTHPAHARPLPALGRANPADLPRARSFAGRWRKSVGAACWSPTTPPPVN